MIFNEEHKSVLINNVLKSNITKYKIKSDYISINNQNKLIGYVYNDNINVLKMEYIILGSYDTTKNIWLWASKSYILNNIFIDENIQIRIYCSKHINAIKDEISIIAYPNFVDTILSLAKLMYEWKHYYLITFKRDTIIDIYIIKNILYECILTQQIN